MDWNTMEHFDDHLQIYDDLNDLLDLQHDELNRYFLEGQLLTITKQEEEEEMIEDDCFTRQNDLQSMEEEIILSQKLSQLSTKSEDMEEDDDDDEEEAVDQISPVINKKRQRSTTTTPDLVSSKKMKMDIDVFDRNDNGKDFNSEENQIPAFLLTTNEFFCQFTKKFNDNNINDIQEIALLLYHIADINIQKQIKLTYYQSGTGTLREPELEPESSILIDRRVWPTQVTSLMLAKRVTDGVTAKNTAEDDHIDCENLLRECLQEMDEQIKQYQKQLHEKRNQLIGFTSTMEKIIGKYVFEYGIRPLKLKRDRKIALLKHNYDDEIIDRKFLQEKPNDYQIQIASRLYGLKTELEKSKRILIELKQRVVYNKPPTSYDSIISMTNVSSNQQLLHKHEKLIQEKKLDRMAIHIFKGEQKLHECENRFNDELSSMWQNHRNLVKDKEMPIALSNLIQQRFTNITDRWRDEHSFRIEYYLENPYGDWDTIENNRKNTTMETVNNEQIIKSIGFQPSMIIDTKHSLNDKQLKLLYRGPTYVSPCQIHISSLCQSTDDALKQQYAPLKHQLAWLVEKYKMDVSLHFRIQNEFYDKFKECFSMTLSPYIEKRARYEMNLVQTIRQSIKTQNLILLRTADNMNTFYLGDSQDFQLKADDCFAKTDNHQVFFTIDEQKNEKQQLKKEIYKLNASISNALRILRRRNEIDENLYNRLVLYQAKIKLSYLYFLPHVSKENVIKLVPVITSHYNLTYKISQYLDQLLRPFVNEIMRSTLFVDEIECIEKLHQYANTEDHLTPTTIFCTIKISNYFALDSHENMIDKVYNFVRNNIASNKFQKISVATIKNLLQLCLYNNVFCYKNKIYTFTKGGPTTSPLIDTLSNIYLSIWQTQIVEDIRRKKELFGRYNDQLFFTWNSTDVELRRLLQSIVQDYPNVSVDISFGSNVLFCNAYISNQNGKLYTRIYHNPSVQKYTLPYVVGHPKVNYSNWIRSALIRAVCVCSLVDDFNQERIYIELSCLVNGYSYMFVESRVAHFYSCFHAETMRYSMDQTMYDKFRRQCFDFIDVHRTLSKKLQQSNDTGNIIHFNYLYEYGARCQFNKEFRKLWNRYFDDHPVLSKEKATISLTTKHLYSLNALLSQQKSFCWLSL